MLHAPLISLCNLIPLRMLHSVTSHRKVTAVSLVPGRHLTPTHWILATSRPW